MGICDVTLSKKSKIVKIYLLKTHWVVFVGEIFFDSDASASRKNILNQFHKQLRNCVCSAVKNQNKDF